MHKVPRYPSLFLLFFVLFLLCVFIFYYFYIHVPRWHKLLLFNSRTEWTALRSLLLIYTFLYCTLFWFLFLIIFIFKGPQMTDKLFALLEQRKDEMNSITITFTNIGNVNMTMNFMVEVPLFSFSFFPPLFLYFFI